MAEYDTVAIVGVGLIGGSIGLALRERGLAREVVGIGRGPSSLSDPNRAGARRTETTLHAALRLGAIDRATTSLAHGVSEANIVVICTPVDRVAEYVVNVAVECPKDALITDAGSTKEVIVTAADAAMASHRAGPRFVGSHPIAGDHRGGPEFARADLFEGRTVVVTPTDHTRPAAVTEISGFWQNLGARVTTMSPAEHDQALAMTSHVPHLVAAALAAATPRELLPLTAGGWRDSTRVAGGDPNLWLPIFASNRRSVLDALERFDGQLAAIREMLEQGDDQRLLDLLEAAATRKSERDALGD
jgi:prephenate dehydrogenase